MKSFETLQSRNKNTPFVFLYTRVIIHAYENKNGNLIHPRSIYLNMVAFNLTAISSYPQAL